MNRRNQILTCTIFTAVVICSFISMHSYVGGKPVTISYATIESRSLTETGTTTTTTTTTATKTENEEETKKPIMNTFYVRIDPNKHIKYTGMSDEADRKMLQHWKRYWSRAGWEPRILSMSDAEQHPDFELFDNELDLDKMPFGYYDKICFFRWLAMAADGTNGGWMSDYDTFPLRAVSYEDTTKLPNNGKLTIHDQTLNGGIPCLVSGTKAEFHRVAGLMLARTIDIGVKEPFWSDMLALMDLHRLDSEEFMVSQGILRGERALDSDRQYPTTEDCENMARRHWAVHFSHSAVQQAVEVGNLAKQRGFEARPTIAEGWLNQWAVRCGEVYHTKFDPVNDV